LLPRWPIGGDFFINLLVALISFPGIAWAGSITAFVQALVFAAMLTRLLPDVAGARPGVGSWPMTAAPAILLSLALIGCTFAGETADTLLERVLVTGSIALAAAGIFGGLLWWSGDVGLTAISALVVGRLRQLRRAEYPERFRRGRGYTAAEITTGLVCRKAGQLRGQMRGRRG
jgi:hypothetical protein